MAWYCWAGTIAYSALALIVAVNMARHLYDGVEPECCREGPIVSAVMGLFFGVVWPLVIVFCFLAVAIDWLEWQLKRILRATLYRGLDRVTKTK